MIISLISGINYHKWQQRLWKEWTQLKGALSSIFYAWLMPDFLISEPLFFNYVSLKWNFDINFICQKFC